MLRLIIRTDMNTQIATGHMMRCLSIAEAAKKENIEIVFVSADENGRSIVEEKGFTYISMGTQWDKMEEEVSEFANVICRIQPDYILIDSYCVTIEYMARIKLLAKVAYIDDLCKEVYPCDTLICYANYYKNFYLSEKYLEKTQLLLGCEYAPLRKEFSYMERREVDYSVKTILLLSGGTDPYHFLKSFLQLRDNKKGVWSDIKIQVICGVYNPDYKELAETYANDTNTEVLINVANIEKYMKEADMAISAGGTSLYELCACGLPTVCYTFVDNQLDNAKSFSDDNVMVYVGDLRGQDTLERIFEEAELLMKNYEKRSEISTKMQNLVDGQGASNIISMLMMN